MEQVAMSDTMATWIVIAVGLGSALIAWAVTWHYMNTKHVALLHQIARERESEQHEIQNARIITDVYGGMRATSLANLEVEE